ncbi:hypothetical protein IQ07DRAFT_390668 [Pyrenochaeta sp. DS3sAY3a]|nr:hypothetical protein IQ07DRAFT_390668 [Pyrenochaeta sp. DS3sAY3a]
MALKTSSPCAINITIYIGVSHHIHVMLIPSQSEATYNEPLRSPKQNTPRLTSSPEPERVKSTSLHNTPTSHLQQTSSPFRPTPKRAIPAPTQPRPKQPSPCRIRRYAQHLHAAYSPRGLSERAGCLGPVMHMTEENKAKTPQKKATNTPSERR